MSSGRSLTAGQRTSSMRFRLRESPRLTTQPRAKIPRRTPTCLFIILPIQHRRIVTLGKFPPTAKAYATLTRRHERQTPTQTERGARAGLAAGGGHALTGRAVKPVHSEQKAHEAAVATVQTVLFLGRKQALRP